METLTSDVALPPRAPAWRVGLPSWLPALPLGLGALLSTLALFLPWEHVTVFNSGVPGSHETADIPLATSLVPSPGATVADLLFAPVFHQSLAQAVAGVVWHAAVPLVGIVLLLAFFTWSARWLRAALLAAFALWSALLGIIGVNFLVTLRYVSTVSYAELASHPPQRNWWTRLIAVSGIYGSGMAGPAWGWYVLWAGLAISAVGIVWWTLTLWRPIAPGVQRTASERQTPQRASRRQISVAVLCTVAFAVWGAALLALPVALVRCPPPTAAQAARAGACTPGSPIYAIYAEAIAPLFTTVARAATFGAAETGQLDYLRTLVVLALALVAAPFALVAVWRAGSPPWRALASGVWGALVLVVTWTAVMSELAFIAPQRTPMSDFFVSTPLDPAAGVFVVPLAALVLVAGLALRWLPTPRRRTVAAADSSVTESSGA